MMKCHPFMHAICCLAWIIAAITCIIIGISAMHVDVYSWPLLNNDQFMMVTKYVIGISGVLLLIKMFMWKSHCECHSGMQK